MSCRAKLQLLLSFLEKGVISHPERRSSFLPLVSSRMAHYRLRVSTLARMASRRQCRVRVIGPLAFRHACRLGIVAKRRDRLYRSGRSADWVKVKNPDAA